MKRINISYPIELIESMNTFPPYSVTPCSVLVNNRECGGVLIVIPGKELRKLKITPPTTPNFPRNFRMLDYEKRIYVIEICMQFSDNPEKLLRLHLNPHQKSVVKLLKLASETKLFSFHFFDTDNQTVSSAVTGFDETETAWFTRNYVLSSKLITDMRGYKIIAKSILDNAPDTDVVCSYFPKKSDLFVRDGHVMVKLNKF